MGFVMTEFLVRRFIKNYDCVENQEVRQKYGILGGVVGICCNLILFLAKLLAGVITSSISVMADAFNNLSDAGSSIVTVVGFKMAGMPADDQHPFGHGRIEYISGLIVSMVIILMGFELGKSSVEKILHPDEPAFHLFSLVILLFSIALKLWMGLFNRNLGMRIDSAAMKAAAMDSISDVAATSAVALGMVISKFSGVNLDGYIGILVALFILYTGLNTARDTLNPLLGQAPDEELVEKIKDEVLSYEGIMGIHDLIIHNYGPGRIIVSLHAEVPCDVDIIKIHDTIDNIERDMRAKFDCEAVIHMDPIVTDDEYSNSVKKKIGVLVKLIDPSLAIHDFRMVEGPSHTNLIFDVVVPHRFRLTDEQVVASITNAVKALDETFEVVIHVDKGYL
ncbi:MAG: cation diffusion facilitator family transporter [Massiliimalia sp.]|jgi:cation diffusion facilitator family transporter